MMTAREREPYEKMAKEEKKKNKGLRPDTERLDNLGDIIATREDPQEMFKNKREKDRRRAKATWPQGQDLIYQKFFLISFECLCELEDPEARGRHSYIPREVGMVEWSMEMGITKELHRFIDTDGIPLGFRSIANDFKEQHHIPIERFELDDSNWRGLWREMLNFINPNEELEEYPPVYCIMHQNKKIQSCIEWLYDKAEMDPTSPNYLEDKLYVLEDMMQDIYENVGHRVSQTSIFDLLTTSAFDFEPTTRCKFHEEEGIAVCALGTVKRFAYSMADSLVASYDFQLTGMHVPDPNAERPTYSVIPGGPVAAAERAPPPPSQNRSRDMGPFSSRDIRYKNQEYYDSDDSDEEELADMLHNQINFSNQSQRAVDNDDDFPALGAAAAPRPAWQKGPPQPRQQGWAPKSVSSEPKPKQGMSLQEAAALRRREEEEAERRIQQAKRMQEPQQRNIPRAAFTPQQQSSIRPAFGGPGGSSGATPGAGRGTHRPAFIPPTTTPRHPAFQSNPGGNPGGPAFVPPRWSGESSGATEKVASRRPESDSFDQGPGAGRQPKFIPPSGDAPVYKPPPPQGQQLTNPGIGRGGGMRPAFIPPTQTGQPPAFVPPSQPAAENPPPPTTMPLASNPPLPTTRPQGM